MREKGWLTDEEYTVAKEAMTSYLQLTPKGVGMYKDVKHNAIAKVLANCALVHEPTLGKEAQSLSFPEKIAITEGNAEKLITDYNLENYTDEEACAYQDRIHWKSLGL